MLPHRRERDTFEALGCAPTRPTVAELRPAWSLDDAVASLRTARDETNIRHRGRIHEMPSRAVMREVLDAVLAVLFPTHLGRTDLDEDTIDFFVGSTLHGAMGKLGEQARRALFFSSDASVVQDGASRRRARTSTEDFVSALPGLRRLLVTDLEAAQDADPMAPSLAEILVCSTSMRAVLHHRVAHALERVGLPFLARLVSEIAFAETGAHIHPAAVISRRFSLDRGTGVVIGETAVIGNNVRIHPAVTLGPGPLPAGPVGTRRHPLVEDDVVIHAGATLLGPITVGAGATIGGNVWITESIPAGRVVVQAASRAD